MSSKMRIKRNVFQMKEDKMPEKNLYEMEISNLPNKKFNKMVIKLFTKPRGKK